MNSITLLLSADLNLEMRLDKSVDHPVVENKISRKAAANRDIPYSCIDYFASATGTNFIDTEFTQWRVFFGVKYSPSKTWPK